MHLNSISFYFSDVDEFYEYLFLLRVTRQLQIVVRDDGADLVDRQKLKTVRKYGGPNSHDSQEWYVANRISI